MAEVCLEQVCKRFGNRYVVRDVNLVVQPGEFLVLVGPSGCGKTTTLRIVAGLEEPTTGEVHIGGRRVTDLPPKDRDIAMVFQNYALYPHMTAQQNIAFGLRMRRTPPSEVAARVKEAAEILGIGSLLQRRPRELSGGERQRVALGRAIVRKPSVFLMDEPLSNLDAKLRTQMRSELKLLHARLGVTTIYVTHDQTEAMTMSDRLAVMNEGVIQQVDTPQRVYESPANMFVAGFVGSPSMNFIPAELSFIEGKVVADCHGFQISLPIHERCLSGAAERIVLGIRPDAFRLRSGADAARENAIRGEVLVIEPLGSELLVHVKAAEQRLVMKAVGGEVVRVGETVELYVASANIHVFDEASGRRVGS